MSPDLSISTIIKALSTLSESSRPYFIHRPPSSIPRFTLIDMGIYKILVGSYTDSIYTLEFDPTPSSGTSTFRYLSQVHVGDNPSWIEVHPSDRSLIFASLEQAPDGQIAVIKYDKDGNGHRIEEATCSSGGADPCTLTVNEDELLIANVSPFIDRVWPFSWSLTGS